MERKSKGINDIYSRDSFHRLFLAVLLLLCLFVAGCESPPPNFVYDFETEADLDLLDWQCGAYFSISEEHVTSGKKSLKMEFFPASSGSENIYPGLGLRNFYSNWSKRHALHFNVFNPENKPLQIVIRIDDKNNPPYDDRFNKDIILRPGTNTIILPFKEMTTTGTQRNLNLDHIESIDLFLDNPEEKHMLFIDNLHLR